MGRHAEFDGDKLERNNLWCPKIVVTEDPNLWFVGGFNTKNFPTV